MHTNARRCRRHAPWLSTPVRGTKRCPQSSSSWRCARHWSRQARPAAAPPSAATDTGSTLVCLVGDPLATSTRTRPASGKKIDFQSDTVKAERARLAASRNDFQAMAATERADGAGDRRDGHRAARRVTLNGTEPSTLTGAGDERRAPGHLRPTAHDDPDLSLVRASEAWASAGGAQRR